MISSRLERLPNSPKPRLFKAKSASNIRPHVDSMIHVLEKKHFTQGCAGLIVHALITIYCTIYMQVPCSKTVTKILFSKLSETRPTIPTYLFIGGKAVALFSPIFLVVSSAKISRWGYRIESRTRGYRTSARRANNSSRETRDGLTLLIVVTEVNGDSTRTNERGPLLVGSLGL